MSQQSRRNPLLDRKLTLVVLAVVCAYLAGVGLGQRAAALGAKPEPPFFYAGKVVDVQGRPVPGVEVRATHRNVDEHSYGYIATAETDAQGDFTIDRATALSGATVAT